MIPQTLSRDDYPDAKLKIRRCTTKGIEHEAYCVSVGIPRPIKYLFGQAPSKYLVAGKTQEDFERKRRSLTNKIYEEFDNKQAE